MPRRATTLAALIAIALMVLPATARAERHKAIRGPLEFNGVSQFPTYKRLGVGIFQMSISWAVVATHPTHEPEGSS